VKKENYAIHKIKLNRGLRQAIRSGGRDERAIDNLIDSIDRFPFARTATKNEDTRDQLEMSVITISMNAVIFTVFAQNDIGNTHGLATVAAQNASKVLG
jgi:hypothetical protein